MIPLIDGDILVYRIGFSTEEEPEGIAVARLANFLEDVIYNELGAEKYYGYLTGAGNFREAVAVTAPYKGQRSGVKPKHYELLRQYMVKAWAFEVVEGQEADDALGIKAMQLKDEGEDPVIVSIDKDLDMIPVKHYNFVKKKRYSICEKTALKNFYRQILTGDRIDNVIGLRGIGPVKADRILEGCSTPEEYYKACVEAYKGLTERVIENGKLLWIRRKNDEVWEPPKHGETI